VKLVDVEPFIQKWKAINCGNCPNFNQVRCIRCPYKDVVQVLEAAEQKRRMKAMVSRDKVLRALKVCQNAEKNGFDCWDLESSPEDCPYREFVEDGCINKLIGDAGELLEQSGGVVQCKDCRWGCWTQNGFGDDMIECTNGDSPVSNSCMVVDPDWFCAEGEEK
jgi:hypothetical protein